MNIAELYARTGSTFREHTDYSPGGLGGKALERQRARYRRENSRRAGRKSGVRRRQLGCLKRGIPPGQLKAPLAFKIRHVAREEFDRRYEKISPQPERPSAAIQWERKREAVWQHVLSTERLLHARGQYFGTTNGRRAKGLELRGHARKDRSIRTYNRMVEAMGIAAFVHVRTPPNRKDYLRIEWRVHRRIKSRLAASYTERGTTTAIAVVPRRKSTSKASVPAASPPDIPPPATPAQVGDEEGEIDFEHSELAVRSRALAQSICADLFGPRFCPDSDPAIHRDVRNGRGRGERGGGGVGLQPDEGSVSGAGGPSDDRRARELAGRIVGRDALGRRAQGRP